jgi:hypothetical protein
MGGPKKPLVAPRRPSLAVAPTPEDFERQREREAFIHGVPGVIGVSARHPPDTSQVSPGHPKPRAAAGSAVLFERKRGPAKRRMNVYFTPEVHRRLEEYCARTGDEMSRFIDTAVEHALDVKAEKE